MTAFRSSPALSSHENQPDLLAGVLRAWGKDADDFEVEAGDGCELSGGIVLVRRRSTGEERLYAGHEVASWVGTLLMDLSRGHFAAPRARALPEPALQ